MPFSMYGLLGSLTGLSRAFVGHFGIHPLGSSSGLPSAPLGTLGILFQGAPLGGDMGAPVGGGGSLQIIWGC